MTEALELSKCKDKGLHGGWYSLFIIGPIFIASYYLGGPINFAKWFYGEWINSKYASEIYGQAYSLYSVDIKKKGIKPSERKFAKDYSIRFLVSDVGIDLNTGEWERIFAYLDREKKEDSQDYSKFVFDKIDGYTLYFETKIYSVKRKIKPHLEDLVKIVSAELEKK